VEISGSVKTRSWVGGLLGATGGAALGLALGWSSVHNSGREEYGAVVWGPLVGGVAGGFLGSHALRTTTEDIRYRAPESGSARNGYCDRVSGLQWGHEVKAMGAHGRRDGA